MAADGITATAKGIDQLKASLNGLPDKLRRKVLLSALRKGAGAVRKAAREAAPTLQAPAPYRTKGLLKRKLSVRVSKVSKAGGHVGVFVNVRPAKSGERGAKSMTDPFYWRFANFGTRRQKAKNFMQAGAAALPQALEIFEREVVPAIERFNKP